MAARPSDNRQTAIRRPKPVSPRVPRSSCTRINKASPYPRAEPVSPCVPHSSCTRISKASPSLHAGQSQCHSVFPAPPAQESVRQARLYAPATANVVARSPSTCTRNSEALKKVFSALRGKEQSHCFGGWRIARSFGKFKFQLRMLGDTVTLPHIWVSSLGYINLLRNSDFNFESRERKTLARFFAWISQIFADSPWSFADSWRSFADMIVWTLWEELGSVK